MRRVVEYYEYETRQGDSFDELALQFYDNELQAHLIIDFNPQYSDVLIFEAGIVLKIPIYEDNKTAETLPPWKKDIEE